MSDELLTAKQVQDLLKVDRTTVYRMLRDGRLVGVKIGQLWRFSRQEVDALLPCLHPPDTHVERKGGSVCAQALPVHCVQVIQDVFAELAQVGSVTIAPSGEPMTEISNSCRFCKIILGSKSGREACIASWRRLAEQQAPRPQFGDCHAGLQYARAGIEMDSEPIGVLIAGQFQAGRPEPTERAQRIRLLADRHELDPETLTEAEREIPTLDERKREQLGGWMERVADTLAEVGRDHAELVSRLRRISAISSLEQE